MDRCVYQIQAQRCHGLSTLSQTNRKLRQIIQAATAASAAQVIPAMAPASRAALQSLKVMAQLIAKSQDLILLKDDALVMAFFKCGMPASETTMARLGPAIYRAPQPQAQLLKIPAPLAWRSPPLEEGRAAAFQVLSWRANEFRSFGCCQTRKTPLLTGENYDVTFARASRAGVKPSWSWSSFVQ